MKFYLAIMFLALCIPFSACMENSGTGADALSCEEYGDSEWRPMDLYIVITHKSVKFVKVTTIEGVDSTGRWSGMPRGTGLEFYDSVSVGDTIRKHSGDMKLYVSRKNKPLYIFHYACSNGPIE